MKRAKVVCISPLYKDITGLIKTFTEGTIYKMTIDHQYYSVINNFGENDFMDHGYFIRNFEIIRFKYGK